MKNFIFKSTDADLQKMFQLLETIQKNGLYCTYRIDSLLKNFEKLLTDKSLQKQVDEYFEEDPFGSAFAQAQKDKDWWSYMDKLSDKSLGQPRDMVPDIIELKVRRLTVYILGSPNLKRLVAELGMDLPLDQ